jgi:alpha-N-arabinofuranosidase
LETEPYIAVNVGSGTPREAYDWVEYVTSDENTPMANLRRKNGREKPWKVKYWGIGNENWGCGGNMTASYYADLFKRFSSYCWVDFKIASGSYGDEYEWTETLMDKVNDEPHLMKGLSLHHYTVAHTWAKKGSAIDFTEDEWFLTIRKNMKIDEYVKNHLAIMENYDPENRVSLMVDEWGNWHDVEPGTEKGFLFQQNTLRDAVTAAIYLNVFNNYCYRVKMANIAQTINVLQAMALTKDDLLVKTPTFYVFKMFKVHFDALMLPTTVISEDYTDGEYSVPSLSVSASKNKEGEINITVANVRVDKDLQTTMTFEGLEDFDVKKSDIITANKMNSYNDFGKGEEVNISKFEGVMKEGNALNIDIPSKSVMLITLK